jgi:hypothetical protein
MSLDSLSDGKVLIINVQSWTGVNSISRCGLSWRKYRVVQESDRCDTGLAATLAAPSSGLSKIGRAESADSSPGIRFVPDT